MSKSEQCRPSEGNGKMAEACEGGRDPWILSVHVATKGKSVKIVWLFSSHRSELEITEVCFAVEAEDRIESGIRVGGRFIHGSVCLAGVCKCLGPSMAIPGEEIYAASVLVQ